eukprot:10419617-Alexandrium_andersonii.AAC.1
MRMVVSAPQVSSERARENSPTGLGLRSSSVSSVGSAGPLQARGSEGRAWRRGDARALSQAGV